MKSLLIFILMIMIVNSENIFSQNDEKYSKIKLLLNNKEQIKEIAKLGIPTEEGFYQKEGKGISLTIVVNKNELKKISLLGLTQEILSADLETEFKQRSKNLSKLNKIKSQAELKGFEYGSMGGNYTFNEVLSELDSMYMLYPNLITKRDSIGNTNEGRTIWAVKISDNPNENEDEPEVLYTALHHAREPQSMMTVIYFMYYLLENYGSDPEVTYIVNNRQLYFIPVINPDGYVFNETNNPNGGGYWRKNRRDNGNGIFGVDLNRNYGYQWGFDNIGSSPDPYSEVYRGTDPFSEPETEAVKNFCELHNFIFALDYHSFGNLLIMPWGYSSSPTPDSEIYLEYGVDMTRFNNYTYGVGDETVGYLTNGSSDDWLYGEQETKNKILAMTPEVGNGQDGFWPDQSRIYPLAQENIYPNLQLALYAGGYVTITDYKIVEVGNGNGYFDPGEDAKIEFTLKNVGQNTSDKVLFSINNSNLIFDSQNNFQLPELNSNEIDTSFSINFHIPEDFPIGSLANFSFKINQHNIERIDTLQEIVIGTPEVIFTENADSITNWESQNYWSKTSRESYSPIFSFTDSPASDYKANTINSLIINKPIIVSSDSLIYLSYKTKWEIEKSWDFGQVYISSDRLNWISVKGNNMSAASGKGMQNIGEFGYDGIQKDWITEEINISEFSGNYRLFIKFSMMSDEGVEMDGWYIDDIEIHSYAKKLTTVENHFLPIEFSLQQNYPNPFNPTTTISYSISNIGNGEDQFVTISIFDVLGRKISTLVNQTQKPGNYQVTWNALNQSSGIYFYRLKCRDFLQTRKMLLIK